MGRRPQGDQPLTNAERQARKRVRHAAERQRCQVWRNALVRIARAGTADRMRALAVVALRDA